MRVLFVCSNPTWTERLDLADEMREIMSSLKGQDLDLMLLPAAQRLDLKLAIAKYDIDILHFSGNATKEEGHILRDEDGGKDPTTGTELQNLLTKADRPIKLTVLNACNTKNTADQIQGSVGATICTNKEVKDAVARKMTRVLYSELSVGKSIEQAYETATLFVREEREEDDVYELAGDKKSEELFSKISAGDAADQGKINVEGRQPYDKHFFLSYLDEQIGDIKKRISFNKKMFLVFLVLGVAFFTLLLFRHDLAMQLFDWFTIEFLELRDKKELIGPYVNKPHLDALIAIGALFPALIAFFQTRLSIHGNQRLTSLQQMRQLAKSSDESPENLQEGLQKILDQCIRGADPDAEPENWFGFLKVLQRPSKDTPQKAGAT